MTAQPRKERRSSVPGCAECAREAAGEPCEKHASCDLMATVGEVMCDPDPGTWSGDDLRHTVGIVRY